MAKDARRHVAGLDGLRAIACLAVFCVHWQQQANLGGKVGPFDIKLLMGNGNTGVCLFFMLSGFLLSLPLWMPDESAPRQRRGLRWSGGFALRRIGRIVPAYYLCLFTLVALGAGKNSRDVLFHALFIHNFTEQTLYSISDPFWTLAVQAQFYVVFPLLMLCLAPLSKKRWAAGVLLLLAIVGSFMGHVAVMKKFNPSPNEYVLSHSLLAHLPHFLLGMFAALVYSVVSRPDEEGGSQRSAWADLFFWLAAVGLLSVLGIPALDATWRIPSGVAYDGYMLGRYNFPYVPALVAILLITAPQARLTTRLLQFRPLRSIGIVSYGVYVYHLPCLMLTRSLMNDANMSVQQHWLMYGLTGISLALVFALVSYVLVERPLLRLTKRITRGKRAEGS